MASMGTMLFPFVWKQLILYVMFLHPSIAEDSYNSFSPQASAGADGLALPFVAIPSPPNEGSSSNLIAAASPGAAMDRGAISYDQVPVPDPSDDLAWNNKPSRNSAVDFPWGAATKDAGLDKPSLNELGPGPYTATGSKFDVASDLQTSTDGRPIMSCTAPFTDQADAYVVHDITFQQSTQWWRSPHAILVSDMLLPYDIRYDVWSNGRNLKYRKVPNFKFMRNNRMVELSNVVRRGWLVGQDPDSKQAALDWFESIAKNAEYISLPQTESQVSHFTTVWVGKVFKELDASGSPYWLPENSERLT